jgi:hypothetical protein
MHPIVRGLCILFAVGFVATSLASVWCTRGAESVRVLRGRPWGVEAVWGAIWGLMFVAVAVPVAVALLD